MINYIPTLGNSIRYTDETQKPLTILLLIVFLLMCGSSSFAVSLFSAIDDGIHNISLTSEHGATHLILQHDEGRHRPISNILAAHEHDSFADLSPDSAYNHKHLGHGIHLDSYDQASPTLKNKAFQRKQLPRKSNSY